MWRRDRKNFNTVSFSAMCGLIGALLAAIGCVLIREAVRRYAYEDLRIVFLIVWVLFIVMAVLVIMIAVSGLKEGMKLRREQSLGSNGAIVLGFTIFLVIAWLFALAGPYIAYAICLNFARMPSFGCQCSAGPRVWLSGLRI